MQMEKNMNNQDSARVRAWLEQGVLLFDGATGTALRAQTEEGEAVERLCLTQPQRVSALHRGYLAAGCRAIKTNTFAAHVSMACENEEDQRGLILAGERGLQRRRICGYRPCAGGSAKRVCVLHRDGRSFFKRRPDMFSF